MGEHKNLYCKNKLKNLSLCMDLEIFRENVELKMVLQSVYAIVHTVVHAVRRMMFVDVAMEVRVENIYSSACMILF